MDFRPTTPRDPALSDPSDYLSALVAVQTEIATASLDLTQVMNLAAERAQMLTGATGAVVELAERDEMVYHAATGSAAACNGLRLPLRASLSGRCVLTGELLQCDDSEIDPRVNAEACRLVQARSLLVVPLLHEGRTVGVLKVISRMPTAFGGRDVQTLRLLAALVAAAMARAAAFEALQREVDERHRVEHSLRESETRFREAFSHAPIGMALVSPCGNWLQVNRSLCQMLGYPEAELRTLNFQAVTHPDDLQSDLDLLRQLLAGEIESYHLEKRYLHRSGHAVWVLLGVSLVRAADGAPLYFISQIQDITARKTTEAQLQAFTGELQRNNRELAQALAEVRQLQGILPICGYCKSIRDDQDYWHEVENYITHRSEARFSHSVCPGCVKKVVQPQLVELRTHRAVEGVEKSADSPRAVRPTILIVEDQPELRATFAEVLEEEGFSVATAPDGLRALEYLRAAPAPNLILLDLLMPVMTGWEFRAEQQKDPSVSTIPVVVMSGLSPAEQRREELGAVTSLTKPVEVETLLATIATHCRPTPA